MIFSFFQEQEKEKYLFFEINFKTGKIWLKIFCKPTSFYNDVAFHCYNFKAFNKTRSNKPSSDRNQEAEECKTKLEQTKTVQYTNA